MLADIALPHKLFHLSLKTFPHKQLLDVLVCGMCSQMAANGTGMKSQDQLRLECRIGPNPNTPM
jgi:hypothetical protein